MSELTPITVDIISDVVCPWCYIGQKRLARAVEIADDVAVEVRWRPYQLDPDVPQGGVDRREYMIGKFGAEDRVKQAHANVMQAASGDGIDFRFDDIKVSPNTLDAHRLIRWAGSDGSEMQGRVARRLFRAFFEEGQDVGDPQVLVSVARDAGMDAAVVEAMLATDTDRDAVREEIALAQRMGVTGVPCFLIEGRYAVVGAQESATLADAIRQVAGMKARGELPEAAG